MHLFHYHFFSFTVYVFVSGISDDDDISVFYSVCSLMRLTQSADNATGVFERFYLDSACSTKREFVCKINIKGGEGGGGGVLLH